jgi:hypothetical protein
MRKLVLLGSGTTVLALAGFFLLQGTGGPNSGGTTSSPSAAPTNLSAIEDSSDLKGPRQPIFFRHDIHAGQYQIQCQYCHYSVAVSPEPGIPSVETCMGCHLVISGSDSGARTEIRKLRKAATDKTPIQWVRIHALARHVHFPHMRHIKAMGPTACMTCHGELAQMPRVFKVNSVTNMGFCVTCHLERKVSRDCTVCHY